MNFDDFVKTIFLAWPCLVEILIGEIIYIHSCLYLCAIFSMWNPSEPWKFLEKKSTVKRALTTQNQGWFCLLYVGGFYAVWLNLRLSFAAWRPFIEIFSFPLRCAIRNRRGRAVLERRLRLRQRRREGGGGRHDDALLCLRLQVRFKLNVHNFYFVYTNHFFSFVPEKVSWLFCFSAWWQR